MTTNSEEVIPAGLQNLYSETGVSFSDQRAKTRRIPLHSNEYSTGKVAWTAVLNASKLDLLLVFHRTVKKPFHQVFALAASHVLAAHLVNTAKAYVG